MVCYGTFQGLWKVIVRSRYSLLIATRVGYMLAFECSYSWQALEQTYGSTTKTKTTFSSFITQIGRVHPVRTVSKHSQVADVLAFMLVMKDPDSLTCEAKEVGPDGV